MAPPSTPTATTAAVDLERSMDVEIEVTSQRAQWLRAAVLGANDGLLSTATLMVGVSAVNNDARTILLAGLAGLLGGAFSMAAGEFVSVYSQYDIELAQLDRTMQQLTNSEPNKKTTTAAAADDGGGAKEEYLRKKKELPSPFKAAVASAVAFAMGALVPLLATLVVRKAAYGVQLGVVVGAVSVALAGFGWLGAVLGSSAPVKSAVRILVGGWVAMGITFGLTKLVGSTSSI